MKCQHIGDICLIKSQDKKLAQEILNKFPRFKTVCWQGRISGKYRKPKIKVLAGDRNTETMHKEVGCLFKLDAAKIMWSKGNHEERKRIVKIAKNNDIVLDMFAGIGYWTIPLAKKVKKTYAIELNPFSFKYLEENIRLNRLSNVTAIKGNCSKVIPNVKADRIIMGLLPSPKKYLPAAKKILKKGGVIHYHCLSIEKIPKGFKLLSKRKIKSYAPKINHIVLDLMLCREAG